MVAASGVKGRKQAGTKAGKKKAPKTKMAKTKKGGGGKKGSIRSRIAKLVDTMTSDFENKAEKGESNSVTELAKLAQLEKDVAGQETPEEVRVIWLESENSK